MKVILAVLAVLAVIAFIGRAHVTIAPVGVPLSVPVPVLLVAAELAVSAALVWILARKVARGPRRLSPYPVRRFA